MVEQGGAFQQFLVNPASGNIPGEGIVQGGSLTGQPGLQVIQLQDVVLEPAEAGLLPQANPDNHYQSQPDDEQTCGNGVPDGGGKPAHYVRLPFACRK